MVNLLLPIFKLFPSRSLRYVPIRPIDASMLTVQPGRLAYSSLPTQPSLRLKRLRDTNQISS